MIPLTRTKAEAHSPLTLVVYGRPKVGKTELLAKLDDFLLLDFEEGSNHVDAMKAKIIGFEAPPKEKSEDKKKREEEGKYYYREFGKEVMAYKKEHKTDPYKGVVVDTITALEDWCEGDATQEYMKMIQGKNFNRLRGMPGLDDDGNIINIDRENYKSVLTLPNGAGYLHLRESFKKWKGSFDYIAKYKVFVAHVKDIMLEKAGREVSAKDIDLTGKIKNITCASVDAIGYLYRDSDNPLELRISFKNHNQDLVGSRAKHLRNQDFVIAINNEDGTIKQHFWNKIYID